MADNATAEISPAYVSWKTFTNFLGKLKETAVPPTLDSSVMKNLSGSSQSQLRTAMRFLGLTRDDDSTTDLLETAVEAYGTDRWAEVFGDLIHAQYAPVIQGLNLDSGTAQQLEARFRDGSKLSGDTLAKAVRFYLNALEGTGQKYSPHFAAPSVSKPKKKAAKREKKEPKGGGKEMDGGAEKPAPPQRLTSGITDKLLEKMPAFDPTWEAEAQTAWFKAIERITGMVSEE